MTTIENLAGVPSAGELSILANELFPDLTEGVYGVPETDIPVASVPEADVSQGITYAATEEAVPGVNVNEAVPSGEEFDWEHPFAYGGGYTDPYFETV